MNTNDRHTAIRLRAPSDRNGNPQMVWALYRGEMLLDAEDCGYSERSALRDLLLRNGGSSAKAQVLYSTIDTTCLEYRRLLRVGRAHVRGLKAQHRAILQHLPSAAGFLWPLDDNGPKVAADYLLERGHPGYLVEAFGLEAGSPQIWRATRDFGPGCLISIDGFSPMAIDECHIQAGPSARILTDENDGFLIAPSSEDATEYLRWEYESGRRDWFDGVSEADQASLARGECVRVGEYEHPTSVDEYVDVLCSDPANEIASMDGAEHKVTRCGVLANMLGWMPRVAYWTQG